MGAVLVLALAMAIDPVRLGVTLLLISRPRPILNLLVYWLGAMFVGVSSAVVVLTMMRDFAPALLQNLSNLVATPTVRHAQLVAGFLALLLNLVRELGLSILVITHDLGLAWNIADRVAVMYLGRIVEEGPTEEILSNPRHPYTQALLSVVSEVDQMTPQVLTGEPPDPTRIPGGCRFHPRCPALASGAAEAAGVADRCRTELLAPLPDRTLHGAACFLSDVEQGMLTD